MAWELLPVNYTDATWSGLKRYTIVNNEDDTVSFQDVTAYSNKENSFFGAKDANRMNEALNTIMSMVENGTDLYEAFQIYFTTQKQTFENTADSTQNDFEEYVNGLKAEGDSAIESIKIDYSNDIAEFEETQEQVFMTWFNAVKDQLSKDAAGNLQVQITEINAELDKKADLGGDNKIPVEQIPEVVSSAKKLEIPRTIAISGGATGTATAFDGSTNITIPVSGLDMSKAKVGVLPVTYGGTGETSLSSITVGKAGSASTLTTARTIRTNLASTTAASFNGSANITPGVTGTLPVANGGTGATSLTGITVGKANACNGLTFLIRSGSATTATNNKVQFVY